MNRAERIAWAIQQSGKKKSEIAGECGVAPASVTGWITGDTKGLRPENLFALEDSTGVCARWIATNTGPRTMGDQPQKIPILPLPDAAKWVISGEEHHSHWPKYADPCGAYSQRSYVVSITGDEHYGLMVPGNHVLVDPEQSVSSGQFGVFYSPETHEAVIAQLSIVLGRQMLVFHNSNKYPPALAPTDMVQAGRVIRILPRDI